MASTAPAFSPGQPPRLSSWRLTCSFLPADLKRAERCSAARGGPAQTGAEPHAAPTPGQAGGGVADSGAVMGQPQPAHLGGSGGLAGLATGSVTIELRLVEVGVVGGEEDGVDNTNIDNSKLYTQPEDVDYAYEKLSAISPNFTIAASFGNVHGVYAPGNVKLSPAILDNSQKYISEKRGLGAKPVNFVFHGGSGSDPKDIKDAIGYGVIKMNIDTDTQWAFWDGIRAYEAKNRDYLQGQIGNPEGAEKPNKKYYDPRVFMREGQKSMVERLKQAFTDLNCIDRN